MFGDPYGEELGEPSEDAKESERWRSICLVKVPLYEFARRFEFFEESRSAPPMHMNSTPCLRLRGEAGLSFEGEEGGMVIPVGMGALGESPECRRLSETSMTSCGVRASGRDISNTHHNSPHPPPSPLLPHLLFRITTINAKYLIIKGRQRHLKSARC